MKTTEARAARGGNDNGGGRRRRFTLRLHETVKISTARNYLVKGVLPRVGLAVVWGPPKSGKSFWVYDLVMHVALGREYRGRKVRQER